MSENGRALVAVGLGGAVGTLARAGLAEAWPHDPAHLPEATLTVNVLGALALGLLTGLLATIGPDKGRRRTVRLAVGTGLMGGLTTHSTYILETAGLLGTDHRPLAFTYLFGSLAVGVSVAAAGLILGESAGRRLRREKNEGDQS
ncbi:fluoride efflux transporter FluC [Actinomyces sp. oral taxon 448]|jgi:CrcB-like protein|uniref:fluoride efflux transporter FluC n=1 Tax=Actinomyces sp. oral taxon 448 TaxID=712124 RepID=UPI0002189BA7|nr:CrcB family protein [Actinomyces sp. oral taxon 448]EGQ75458.1 camphor resistance protein CrcB [Actinomyces sp. oral taxon 448 str. F0400]